MIGAGASMDQNQAPEHVFRQAFLLFDTNNDGRITAEELAAVVGQLGMDLTEVDLHEMIREVDSDGNGTIEFNEFKEHMAKKHGESDADEEMLEYFQWIDRDNNGLISPGELRDFIIRHGKTITDTELAEMINEVDIDGDGHVNFQEFVQTCRVQ